MQIAHDTDGKIWLVGTSLPAQLNDVSLTVVELSDDQAAAYEALSGDRAGTTWDGSGFTAIPLPPPEE